MWLSFMKKAIDDKSAVDFRHYVKACCDAEINELNSLVESL
jgi:hypothetical protein